MARMRRAQFGRSSPIALTLPDAEFRYAFHSGTQAQCHYALLNGADVHQVANATGLNSAGVLVEWTQWALQQRELYEQTSPGDASLGISVDEYERVRETIHGAPDT